jgi:hypothetical protein
MAMTPEEAARIVKALRKGGVSTGASDTFLQSEKLRRELTERIALAMTDKEFGPGSSLYALLFPSIAIAYIAARGQRGEARDNLSAIIDDGFNAIEDVFRADPELKRRLEYYARSGEGADATATFAAFANSSVL